MLVCLFFVKLCLIIVSDIGVLDVMTYLRITILSQDLPRAARKVEIERVASTVLGDTIPSHFVVLPSTSLPDGEAMERVERDDDSDVKNFHRQLLEEGREPDGEQVATKNREDDTHQEIISRKDEMRRKGNLPTFSLSVARNMLVKVMDTLQHLCETHHDEEETKRKDGEEENEREEEDDDDEKGGNG